MEKAVRVAFTADSKSYRALKVEAAKRGILMQEILSQALSMWFKSKGVVIDEQDKESGQVG